MTVSGSAMLDAVNWVRDVLLGPAGEALAVVGVAAIGALMLGGRVPVRRGVTVLAGCFILFGARAIAGGLLAIAGSARVADAALPTTPAAAVPAPPTPAPVDPYAGASVPMDPAN